MAQIVKMPDGVNVSFPDDMPKEEIRALIEEKFPDAAKAKASGKGKSPLFTVGKPEGLSAPGNLDLNARTVYHGKPRDQPGVDYRTENSFSIGTDQGEVLIPSVVGGRQLTEDEAIAHYEKTGENLGVFSSPEAAEKYAVNLHNRQGSYYSPPEARGNAAPPTRPVDISAGAAAVASPPEGTDGTPYGQVTPAGTYASELMSGVNKGIANLMSMPAMLGNGLFSIGPAIVNAATGSDFKNADYFPDPGKHARNIMEMTGAIRPPIDDLGHKVARRVGEEVGASLPLGLTKPVTTVISAIGSGLGASAAQEIDPNNPWLELAGQFGGGMLTNVLGNTAKRLATTMPKPKGAALTADDLELLKNEAYKTVDSLGAKYSPQGYGKLVSQMDNAVTSKNISPTRHPKAYSLLQDFKARAGKQYSGGLSLTELDQLRQEVRRDLLRSSDASERHFGDLMMDEIDDFIRKAGSKDMLAGDGKAANEAVLAARDLNTRFRKTELIEDALYAADLRTAASSGGDVTAAIKRAFNSILLNPKKAASYSADEIADMEKLVKSGGGSKMLSMIGSLSADTGFKAILHGLLATHLGPLYAAVPILGTGAKALAGGRVAKEAEKIRAKVAAGPVPGNSLRPPAAGAPVASGAALTGAVANTFANDNEPQLGNSLRLTN